MNKKNLKESIIIKALKDSDYKKQLLNNPKEAALFVAKDILSEEEIENITEINFKIIEEQQNNMTIVLPYLAEEQKEKIASLTDEELADVSGGTGGGNSWCHCRD